MEKTPQFNIEETFCEYLSKYYRGSNNPVSSKTLEAVFLHSAAHSGRWCGGPAAAVRFKQRPKLVSYIRFNHHRVVLCCPL